MVISDWSSDGGSSDLARANADALEDQREFVHQRDIEIALRVLDDLGGLGDLDRWRAVDAGVDDRTISVGNAVQCFRAIARHYLDDLAQRTFALARIDALRRIREMEIGAVFARSEERRVGKECVSTC